MGAAGARERTIMGRSELHTLRPRGGTIRARVTVVIAEHPAVLNLAGDTPAGGDPSSSGSFRLCQSRPQLPRTAGSSSSYDASYLLCVLLRNPACCAASR
ncbi:hypothetical protein TraAM80_10432 [Trypanosoma rangeli]|uniref:Uncharacterized protein n=1 Tax=Trypanosoma rangeli TaxID=5698 RepID=A0A3R7KID5_TRYRA|nr:uncharacterized protein TraAM80_10432 [Trypanosoma rangeli]RNE95056.1 hypothetical protein TraAM80_10432 [Trypanosoma rangeli]|eukprot:RNE95056.1 hypothetical protein TraAM80_10432 [Trypanosoma rangeli]